MQLKQAKGNLLYSSNKLGKPVIQLKQTGKPDVQLKQAGGNQTHSSNKQGETCYTAQTSWEKPVTQLGGKPVTQLKQAGGNLLYSSNKLRET